MSSYGLEILDEAECHELLRTQRVGRVGISCGSLAVLPVLYGLLDGDVVFRTAPGEKLIAATLNRDIVFEVDLIDLTRSSGWSINVLGWAEEIIDPDELARVEALGLESWAGEFRDRVVRIHADAISGRRITPATEAAG